MEPILAEGQESILVAFSRISSAVVDAIELLGQIRAAIEDERDYLRDLYHIEAEAGKLEELIQAQQAERDAFHKEMQLERSRWREEKMDLDRTRQRDEHEYNARLETARRNDLDERARLFGLRPKIDLLRRRRKWVFPSRSKT